MDLLGSILSDMDKQGPPRMSEKDKLARKQRKELLEQNKKEHQKKMTEFQNKIEATVNELIKDPLKRCHEFPPMNTCERTIVHEVAETAGLTALSFGIDGIDRHVQVYKREFAPSDEEVDEMRHSGVWDIEIARHAVATKKQEAKEMEEEKAKKPMDFVPASNYKEKYEHLIGKEAGEGAATRTVTNKQYGFVPSENKKDQRSIEQTLDEMRAKKRQKTSNDS